MDGFLFVCTRYFTKSTAISNCKNKTIYASTFYNDNFFMFIDQYEISLSKYLKTIALFMEGSLSTIHSVD